MSKSAKDLFRNIFGGSDGESSQDLLSSNQGYRLLQNRPELLNDPRLMQALQSYGSGQGSLQDAIRAVGAGKYSGERERIEKAIRDLSNQHDSIMGKLWAEGGQLDRGSVNWLNAEIENQRRQLDRLNQGLDPVTGNTQDHMTGVMELFSNPLTGTQAATEQVQNNPLFAGMFGKDGLMGARQAEEKDLASRGWTLQPEDHEAYGQASDEIARLFGQEENALAQALASRGLAAAPSGAAQVGYSGLMGNKHERLAAKQRQIANDRMDMNRRRLQEIREINNQTQQMAGDEIRHQYDRNMEGVKRYDKALADSLAAAQARQNQSNTAFTQKQETASDGMVGDLLNVGLGAAGGGLGKSIGKGLGSSLFPEKKVKPTGSGG